VTTTEAEALAKQIEDLSPPEKLRLGAALAISKGKDR
jgi:hypothetical protein